MDVTVYGKSGLQNRVSCMHVRECMQVHDIKNICITFRVGGALLTLRNANATSVAIYACKSSTCNSTLVFTAITVRSPLNNFIIIAHKVVLTAKTSNEV